MSTDKLDLTEQQGIVADNNHITITMNEVLNATQEETIVIEHQEEQS